MMATFRRQFRRTCTLPLVTLSAGQDDWDALLGLIEKLKKYEPETQAWYRLLICLVRAFDDGTQRARRCKSSGCTSFIMLAVSERASVAG